MIELYWFMLTRGDFAAVEHKVLARFLVETRNTNSVLGVDLNRTFPFPIRHSVASVLQRDGADGAFGKSI